MTRWRRRLARLLVVLLILSGVGTQAAIADDTLSVRRKPDKTASESAGRAEKPSAKTADETQARATVAMTYQDAELKGVDVEGGSLVKGVEGVAKAIEGAGLGPTRHATFEVAVTMTYERIAQGLYDVSLQVGEPALQLDARLKPEIRNALEREARTLVLRLKSWRRPLTESEVRRLFGYDERIEIAIPEPFAHIKTWSHTPPVVTLRLEAPAKPRPILRYVTFSPAGEKDVLYALPIGQAFWVEAQYYSLPDASASRRVTLAWEGGTLDLTLQPTDRPLFFLAGPYYVVPPPEPSAPATNQPVAPAPEG